MTLLNLSLPDHSYLFGFLQGDGHLSADGNKGKLAVELKEADVRILQAFAAMFDFYSLVSSRTRSTNFKEDAATCSWTVNKWAFREELKRLGIPEGKKCWSISPPRLDYRESDYWRGLIDADGSVGSTVDGRPFVSLCTSSDAIADGYKNFVLVHAGWRPKTKRNKRDGAYNVLIYSEDAQAVAQALYYVGALALPRKERAAWEILRWRRPPNVSRRARHAAPVIEDRESYCDTSTRCYQLSLLYQERISWSEKCAPYAARKWTDDVVCDRILAIAGNDTVWPSRTTFYAAGEVQLHRAIQGRTNYFIQKTGLIPRRVPTSFWNSVRDATALRGSVEDAAASLRLTTHSVRARRMLLNAQKRES